MGIREVVAIAVLQQILQALAAAAGQAGASATDSQKKAWLVALSVAANNLNVIAGFGAKAAAAEFSAITAAQTALAAELAAATPPPPGPVAVAPHKDSSVRS